MAQFRWNPSPPPPHSARSTNFREGIFPRRQQSSPSSDLPDPTAAQARDQHFPLWLVFPLIFVALYLSHFALLRLPYYWDEAGYYIPAAYDLFRTGALIPSSTLSNAHPPLPSLYLALWWKISGFSPHDHPPRRAASSPPSRCSAVYRLAQRVTGADLRSPRQPRCSPRSIQSGLRRARSRMPISSPPPSPCGDSSSTCPAQVSRISRPPRFCFTLAALSKETAICTPLALACYEAWRRTTRPIHPADRPCATSRWLLTPLLPLCGWYVYHWRHTGYVFGNPGIPSLQRDRHALPAAHPSRARSIASCTLPCT